MAKAKRVKVLHGALDIIGEGANEAIILRGVIDVESLERLQVASYQREILPGASARELMEAFKAGGRVPDVELGMRGQTVSDRDGVFYLGDEVYIIDGLQRVTAARRLVQQGTQVPIHLGATIHFDTTEVWERRRFQILNGRRTKLSPNVLARNARHDSTAIAVLFDMSTEADSFPLKGRVSWSQRMKRDELLTAMVLLKIAGRLHAHLGPGRYNNLTGIQDGLDQIVETLGVPLFRDNVGTFFDLIDGAWGIRTVVYRESTTHLRMTFLDVLARLFRRHHHVFFRDEGRRLYIPRDYQRKIKTFPVADPTVMQLAGAGGKAVDLLYGLMVEHLNKGRRTNRLVEPVNGASNSGSQQESGSK